MKKRIIALLLAIQMVLSIMPMPVYAEDGNIIPTEGEPEPTTLAATEPTTEPATDAPCGTCNQYNCESDHTNWCNICKVDNCEKEHKTCEKCGTIDCTVDHTNWCDICKVDNCGKEHKQCVTCGTIDCTKEHKACETCYVIDCTADHTNWCDICKFDNCGKNHDTTDTQTQDTSSEQVNAVNEDEPHPMVGKYAKITSVFPVLWKDPTNNDPALQVSPTAGTMPAVVKIVDVHVYSETLTLYKLDAAEGTWPDAYKDYRYMESTKLTIVEKCDICGEYDCSTEHVKCEHCGEYDCDGHVQCEHCGEMDCTKLHFYCDICKRYDCGLAHLYCNICDKYDCGETHTFCGTCGEFDCTTEHEDIYKPAGKPVVPDSVTLNPNKDVTVVDEAGDASDSFHLFEGSKSSISAWSKLDEKSETYQWQVRYGKDLWADIQGQTEKGLLASPAMFRSIIRLEGSAAVRCVIKAGDETVISEEIPVTISEQPAVSMLKLLPRQTPLADEPGDGGTSATAEDMVNLIINYNYSKNNEIAANSWVGTLPKGEAYKPTAPIIVPDIAGYSPRLLDNTYTGVKLNGHELSLDLTASDLENNCTINIVYDPALVKVVVNHHQQNVEDDNYSLHETEILDLYTEDLVGDVHKNYEGFYNLLYEHPTVAADGSTVVDVYYDRYYYLMTFDLKGGYGCDAIYARYGATIEDQGEPTKAGYMFSHWTDVNGNTTRINATMPVGNTTYVAVWIAADTAKVSVVFWGENPNDEGYSYVETKEITAKTGISYTFNGNGGLICGYHDHDADCYALTCTTAEHNHIASGCTLNCIHTAHTLDCYNTTGGWKEEGIREGVSAEDQGNGIWIYKTGGFIGIGATSHYYVKVGDTWYCSANGNETQITHQCTHTSHEDRCYCGQPEHTHTDYTGSCYTLSCDEPTHTHTSSCYDNLTGLDSELWTFVRSDTVTVTADGNTVVNVYYDRKEFTLTFVQNNSTVKTITNKWGADIHSQFPIKNSSNQTMWWTVPSGCESMNPGTEFGSLDTMPAENITFNYDDAESGKTLHYYVEALPNDDDAKTAVEIYNGFTTDNYTNIDGTKKYISYKDIDLTSSSYTYLTYTEEFHNITGFRQYVSYPKFNKHELGGTTSSNLPTNCYLMYARNGFDIVFYNPTDLLKTEENVPYQMPLSGYNWTPTADKAPNVYEPGTVRFDGWYLNAECSGEPFDFSANTMPAGPNNADGEVALALYAKWVPVSRTVRFFLDKDDMEEQKIIPDRMAEIYAAAHGGATDPNNPYRKFATRNDVPNKSFLEDIPTPAVSEGYEAHPYAGWTFVGWFYMEDGEEKAFDPAHMPVVKNLDLYGKWNSSVLCPYQIRYVLDEDGDGVLDDNEKTYVADPVTGSTLAGNSRTFDAKGDTALYTDYQEGYYPNVASHNVDFMPMDKDNDGEQDLQVYVFLYKTGPAVPYTVEYLDKATGKSVVVNGAPVPNKVVNGNKKAVVTENFMPISGYLPDKYQKTITVVPGGENVITFWYTADTKHAMYQINHFVQTLDGSGWNQYRTATFTGDIGKLYTAEALEITGMSFSADETRKSYESGKSPLGHDLPNTDVTIIDSPGSVQCVLTADGLELNLFYVRNPYPYIIYYKEKTTGQAVSEAVSGTAPYGQVLRGYKDLNNLGFTCENADATKTIQIEEVAEGGEPQINVLTYWYVRQSGKLKISKIVDIVDNSTGVTAPDQEFTFEIRNDGKGFSDSTEFQRFTCKIYNAQNTEIETRTLTLDENKKLTVVLKDGQHAIIEGLPTDRYVVNELPVLGFVSNIDNGVNVLVTNSQTPVEVNVTNNFPVYTGNLIIRKEVKQAYENDVLPDDGFVFTMTLTPVDEAMEIDRPYSYTIFNSDNTVAQAPVSGSVETNETTETVQFSLRNGQYVKFENLVVGQYNVTETMDDDYDTEYFIYAENGQQMYSGKSNTFTEDVQIVAGKEVSAKFVNTYKRHRGDLKLIKTVVEEYEDDVWTNSTFSFKLDDWKTPLQQGEYSIKVSNEDEKRTIILGSSGEFTVENLNIPVVDDPNSLTQSAEILIEDLPVTNNMNGMVQTVIETTTSFTYGKDEAAKSYDYAISTVSSVDQYNQNFGAVRIEGQEIPTELTFTNTFRRTTGNLKITKRVEKVSDKVNIDTNQQFTFEVVLKDGMLSGSYACSIVGADNQIVENSVTQLTVSDGKLSVQLKHNQSVLIQGLPVGNYTVTELAVDGYDSSFNSFNDTLNTADPAVIKTNQTTELICQNRYPVYFSDLIVEKKVVTPSSFREADRAPANDVFTYRVTISEYSKFVNLDNGITATFYNANGQEQPPQTLRFTNGDNGQDLTFNLKNGEKVKLNLPSCKYVIEETGLIRGDSTVSVTDHYQMSYTVGNESGVAGKQYALASGAEVNVLFTNTWKRHTGSLTVSKTAENAAGETFLFQITGPNNFSMILPLKAGESKEIFDLPLGEYTVKENTAWSWRYTADQSSVKVALTGTDPSATVNITNTLSNDNWLNDVKVKANTFNPATSSTN